MHCELSIGIANKSSTSTIAYCLVYYDMHNTFVKYELNAKKYMNFRYLQYLYFKWTFSTV